MGQNSSGYRQKYAFWHFGLQSWNPMSCGPSVINKLDFDSPKVYGDNFIFDGLGKYWIKEADNSLKTRILYHVIYEQNRPSVLIKISLFAGPCFSSLIQFSFNCWAVPPQPIWVDWQPALQKHVHRLHPSPVDLKEVSEDVFFLQYLSPQDSVKYSPFLQFLPSRNSCILAVG